MKAIPLYDRLMEKVIFHPKTRCWVFTGNINQGGYGLLHAGRGHHIQRGAHRLSYEVHVGPIPAGVHVCHTCDNRKCVNPEHLFLGTAKANMEDKVRKGRQARHLGELHPHALLTEEQVRCIRQRARNAPRGTQARLAEELNVSQKCISDVVRGHCWGWLQ